MSELMKLQTDTKDFREQLLITASALALLAACYGSNESQAADQDADRPTVWIELGGQLQSLNDSSETFSPPFMASITQANLLSALSVQKPMAFAISEDAKLAFRSDNSDWTFSASIQYGRSSANRQLHQQTANKTVPVHFTLPSFGGAPFGPKYYYPAQHARFADGQAALAETHLIVDFQAGKDAGLGLFGGKGSSVLSAGVRIAQLTSKSNVALRAEPDVQYPTAPITSKYELKAFDNYHVRFHDYAAMMEAQRSFRGTGPSLAWTASVPLTGETGNGQLSLDWAMNGAVLFGRQKAEGRHKTNVKSYYETQWRAGFPIGGVHHGYFINQAAQHTSSGFHNYTGAPTAHQTHSRNFNRARIVAVPNIGGTIGFSYRIEDFKVSLGYRADFFFGAIDDGIDARKSEDIGFHGPFATISIGLGG